MTGSSDKTRLKSVDSKVPKTSSSNLKTRVSTDKANRTRKKNENKTRIAPASRPAKQGEDKTRIAGEKHYASPQSAEKIRYKPSQVKGREKTRIKPAQKIEQFPQALETPAENTQPRSEGVLKKRFVLEQVIGAGGMGVVYKAKDLLKVEAQDRDPYVAIKVLSDEFKSHPEAFISLQRESRKTQRIAHPNIVNVFDFDRDEDTVFMTMEFLDGSPLDELINQYKSTGLPTDDVLEIIKGITSALAYAHSEHIIHSDFKPGNVFVTKKGIAKAFDFGIARAVAQVEHMEESPQDQPVFDAGNLGALTPAYASLEMLEGDEPDVRDDIYALGCVAYEMFTGQHPYNKIPADEAERQGLKAKRISHIKKYQWQAIEKAIAFRREDRLSSVNQFVEEFTPKLKAGVSWISVLALILMLTAAGYFFFYQQQN